MRATGNTYIRVSVKWKNSVVHSSRSECILGNVNPLSNSRVRSWGTVCNKIEFPQFCRTTGSSVLDVTLFTFCPAQLCEGSVFPTTVALCNCTSVGTLTDYTSRCVKHNLEIDWGGPSARSPFYYSTFPIFICYKKPSATPPPLAERYIWSYGHSTTMNGSVGFEFFIFNYGT